MRSFSLQTSLLALLAIAIALPAVANDCSECGLRHPGSRSRELAVLNTTDLVNHLREPSSSSYDWSKVDRLPVRTRPTTDQTIAMNDHSALVKAMQTDKVTFYKLRYLLPTRFKIADGKEFQPIIDDVMLKMASTDSGKQAMCSFAVDSEKDVEQYFSVSNAAAKKIKAGCKGVKVPEPVVNRLRIMRRVIPPFQPIPAVPPKKFVFIFSDTARPGVEAYTSQQNVTYMVLGRETMNPDHVLRTTAHEMAISYDQLSRVAYLYDPTSWDQTLGLAYGRNSYEGAPFEKKSSAEVQELKCAYRDPAIKYAATAQRAFRFEDSVVNELGDTQRSPSVAANGTCAQILAKNSVLLESMARAVSWETGGYKTSCEKEGGVARDPKARVQQLLSRIRTMEKLKLKDQRNGKTVSFCDEVMTPRLGPNELDIYSGGPRPRMGGTEYTPSDDSLERALRGESLTKEELNRLGDSLSFPNMDQLYREEDARGRNVQ